MHLLLLTPINRQPEGPGPPHRGAGAVRRGRDRCLREGLLRPVEADVPVRLLGRAAQHGEGQAGAGRGAAQPADHRGRQEVVRDVVRGLRPEEDAEGGRRGPGAAAEGVGATGGGRVRRRHGPRLREDDRPPRPAQPVLHHEMKMAWRRDFRCSCCSVVCKRCEYLVASWL